MNTINKNVLNSNPFLNSAGMGNNFSQGNSQTTSVQAPNTNPYVTRNTPQGTNTNMTTSNTTQSTITNYMLKTPTITGQNGVGTNFSNQTFGGTLNTPNNGNRMQFNNNNTVSNFNQGSNTGTGGTENPFLSSVQVKSNNSSNFNVQTTSINNSNTSNNIISNSINRPNSSITTGSNINSTWGNMNNNIIGNNTTSNNLRTSPINSYNTRSTTSIYNGSSYNPSLTSYNTFNSSNNFGFGDLPTSLTSKVNEKKEYSLDAIKSKMNFSNFKQEDISNAHLYRIPEMKDEDSNKTISSHCISHLPEYFAFSQEELRYLNLKKKTNTPFDLNTVYVNLTKKDKFTLANRLEHNDQFIQASFNTTEKNKLSCWKKNLEQYNKDDTFDPMVNNVTTLLISPNRINNTFNSGNNFNTNLTTGNFNLGNSNTFTGSSGTNTNFNSMGNQIQNNNISNLNVLSGTNYNKSPTTGTFNSMGQNYMNNNVSNINSNPFAVNSNIIKTNNSTSVNKLQFSHSQNLNQNQSEVGGGVWNAFTNNNSNQGLNNNSNQFNNTGYNNQLSFTNHNTNFNNQNQNFNPNFINNSQINNSNQMGNFMNTNNQMNAGNYNNNNFNTNNNPLINSNLVKYDQNLNNYNIPQNYQNYQNNNFNIPNNYNYTTNPLNTINILDNIEKGFKDRQDVINQNPEKKVDHILIQLENNALKSKLEYIKNDDYISGFEKKKKSQEIYNNSHYKMAYIDNTIRDHEVIKAIQNKSYKNKRSDEKEKGSYYDNYINPERLLKVNNNSNNSNNICNINSYNKNYTKFKDNKTCIDYTQEKNKIIHNYQILESSKNNNFLNPVNSNLIRTNVPQINNNINENENSINPQPIFNTNNSENKYYIQIEFDSPIYLRLFYHAKNIVSIANLKETIRNKLNDNPDFKKLRFATKDFQFLLQETILVVKEVGYINLDDLFNPSNQFSNNNHTNFTQESSKSTNERNIKIKAIFTADNGICHKIVKVISENPNAKTKLSMSQNFNNNNTNNSNSSIKSNPPRMTKDFILTPSMNELKQMTNHQLKCIKKFIIENKFGSVEYENVDLRDTNLDVVNIKSLHFFLNNLEEKSYRNLDKECKIQFKNSLIYKRVNDKNEFNIFIFNLAEENNAEFVRYDNDHDTLHFMYPKLI